jgi:hypothetical protein
MAFWQFLGDLHPKLVQFPLVLLVAGLSFDACGLPRSPRTRRRRTRSAPAVVQRLPPGREDHEAPRADVRLWIQFQRHGQVGVVSYVVDVKSPLLPAGAIRFLLEG